MMDTSLALEYLWVLIILVGLEGLLSADNALVLAIMIKHLPGGQREKALSYGLVIAFILRFSSLFIISFLVDVWYIQAIGAGYLLFISIKNLYQKCTGSGESHPQESKGNGNGFWPTVFKLGIADMAFAVDSILAAVALAVALPPTGLGHVGGLDIGQFSIVLAGGMLGLIIIRFAANVFVDVLQKRPTLEVAAFLIVGWVGVKLVVITLAHPDLAFIPADFPESTVWKATFYIVLISIAMIGWLASNKDAKK